MSLGTMIIKCRTSEREVKGGGALVSRNNDYYQVEPGGGGHLSLGTMIIKCRTSERKR